MKIVKLTKIRVGSLLQECFDIHCLPVGVNWELFFWTLTVTAAGPQQFKSLFIQKRDILSRHACMHALFLCQQTGIMMLKIAQNRGNCSTGAPTLQHSLCLFCYISACL